MFLRNVSVLLSLLLLLSCKPQDNYRPGGPFYYKTGITYQGHYPCEELTKEQAEVLAGNGLAYYVAYFNRYKLPTIIEKHYKDEVSKTELFYADDKPTKVVSTDGKGEIVSVQEMFYRDGRLAETVTTDRNGTRKVRSHHGKAIGP